MATQAKAPSGALITGAVLLLLALGGCGYGCVTFGGFFSDLTDVVQGSRSTPLGEPIQWTATGDHAVILTSSPSAICEVTDDSGSVVTLEQPGAGTTQSIETTDGVPLEFQYYFASEADRQYGVICSASGEMAGEYVVVPFPGLGKLLSGGIGLISGILFFIVGVILLIVGLVKRSNWKKQQVPGAPNQGTPAGYAPPPGVPGGYGAPGYPQPSGPPPAAPAPPPGYPPQAPPPGYPPQAPPPGYPPQAPPPGYPPQDAPPEGPQDPPYPSTPPSG